MKIAQFFTGTGVWGAVLFVLGNLLSSWGWWQLMTQLTTSEFYVAFAVGGALAVIVSIPMMIIGRGYDVTIVHIPKDRIT